MKITTNSAQGLENSAENWSDLPYFLAVSRSGSLRGAAEMLNSTHATVRRRVEALEAAYSVRLFDRSVDGLTLTPAGRTILPRAEAAEREVLAARRQLSGLDLEASGRVRVSLPPALSSIIVPQIIADFAKAHPQIDIAITVTNRLQDLGRHETDVAIRIGFEVSDDVVGRRVLQYGKGIYASKDYVAEDFPAAGPKGEGLTWIGWGDEDPLPAWVRDSPFPKASVRHAVREAVMQMHLVKSGMGMSYLPCFAASFEPDLVQVPGTEVELDRSIWLLLHSDLKRTTRVRLFVDHVAKELREKRALFLGPLA